MNDCALATLGAVTPTHAHVVITHYFCQWFIAAAPTRERTLVQPDSAQHPG
jgi:hypothetical protein